MCFYSVFYFFLVFFSFSFYCVPCVPFHNEYINVSQILNNVSQVNYSNYICYHIRPEGQVCDAERDLLAMAFYLVCE